VKVSARVKRVSVAKAQKKAADAHKKALTATTEAARMDTEPFVPMVTGRLRRSAETESRPSRGLLIWGSMSVPYARGQYYGFPGKSTPGTTMHWFEHAKARFKRSWNKVMASEYKRHMRG